MGLGSVTCQAIRSERAFWVDIERPASPSTKENGEAFSNLISYSVEAGKSKVFRVGSECSADALFVEGVHLTRDVKHRIEHEEKLG